MMKRIHENTQSERTVIFIFELPRCVLSSESDGCNILQNGSLVFYVALCLKQSKT